MLGKTAKVYVRGQRRVGGNLLQRDITQTYKTPRKIPRETSVTLTPDQLSALAGGCSIPTTSLARCNTRSSTSLQFAPLGAVAAPGVTQLLMPSEAPLAALLLRRGQGAGGKDLAHSHWPEMSAAWKMETVITRNPIFVTFYWNKFLIITAISLGKDCISLTKKYPLILLIFNYAIYFIGWYFYTIFVANI